MRPKIRFVLALVMASLVFSIIAVVQAQVTPSVTITATDATAGEGDGNTAAFTIMRTDDTTDALTVSYSVGGTATAGSDYSTLTGSVTIPVGASSAVITVIPLDDAVIEGPETVIATLIADAGYSIGGQNSAPITIEDDEEASDLPVISVSATDAGAAEAGLDPGSFTVTRTGSTAAVLTINYSVGGSATAGSDYSTLTGSVTIPVGDGNATIAVSPLDDTLAEGPETVMVTLIANAGYVIGSQSSATAAIADNDQDSTLSVVTIAATDANAAEAGPDTGMFAITRTGGIVNPLTVNYSVSGTATAGSDYSALSTSATIPAGSSVAVIAISPLSDASTEGSETVIVTLTPSANYSVGSNASATVTIADGDQDNDDGDDGDNHGDDDGDDRGNTRPGWGCGDRNHEHSGPSGRGGDKESPCDRHGDDDDDDDNDNNAGSADSQESNNGNGKGHDKGHNKDKSGHDDGNGRGNSNNGSGNGNGHGRGRH